MNIQKRLFFSEEAIMLVILLNAITIFLQGFHLESNLLHRLSDLDNIFTLYFIAEAVYKVKLLGSRQYFRDGWNRFDFLLILLATPSLLFWFSSNDNAGLDFLLIFRTARALKFIRFFRFIPGIQVLTSGIKRALKASVLVIMAFFIYNFIVAVLSCYMFAELSPEHFGNPLSSLYSVFKVFTIEGWYEIPESMMEAATPWQEVGIKSFFVIILLTGGIFGLSLVNSIFVDAMVMDNNDELEKKIDSLNLKVDQLMEQLKEKESV
ncbi:ion transporter [Persicobacter sp. CCB-QB2]|uniref:ion transporter n=1 Tax=Persicobacter sp. CCB-QB2 TaxID=1561025 RepID=UPI0006A9FD34|nr:ion transporter [Persicobacter sp. CCB-QB2]